jgi:transposase
MARSSRSRRSTEYCFTDHSIAHYQLFRKTLYVQQILAPSLRPGQVVMLDHLSAHKGEAVRLAVEGVGARLCFLPAYTPDFNPIELAFAKIKV